jgi:hypothetical protein
MKPFLSILVLAVSLWGQEPATRPQTSKVVDTWTTAGEANGRFWRTLDKDGKLGLVVGYADGVKQILALVSQGDFELFKKLQRPVLSPLTHEEVISALDRIYETPENRPISIAVAMTAVAARANGTPESEVQRKIEDLRARAVK